MLKTILNALTRIITAVGAFFVGSASGKNKERANNAKNTLQAVKEANKAANRTDNLPIADKLQWLKERGLVRGDKPTNGTPK